MNCFKHTGKEASGACVYCGKLFCSDCLVELHGKNYCRGDIGKVVNEARESRIYSKPNVIVNNNGFAYPYKNKIVALILAIFLGGLGFHRFYVGKIGTGLLWLFTGGLFGIGWIIDIILIITGGFRDSAGMPLR
jgi:hypothetical protein